MTTILQFHTRAGRTAPAGQPDFSAALPGGAGLGDTAGTRPRPRTAAMASLEAPWAPSPETAVSFLVNALYLPDRHRVLAWEGGYAAPWARETEARLALLGHGVETRGPAGDAPAGAALRGAGRFERAMFLAQAFGYLSDGENLAWLRGMRAVLEPGGLLFFQVVDRDRAWGLSGRAWDGSGGRLRAVDFDPATGRLSVRVREARGGAAGTPESALGDSHLALAQAVSAASVRTFNLTEIRDWLERAGLRLERAYGDWEAGSPGAARAGRLLVVARKPRGRPRTSKDMLTKHPRILA